MKPIVGYVRVLNGEPVKLYLSGILPFLPVFLEPHFLNPHGEEVRKVEVRFVEEKAEPARRVK
jgi:hypothetical protein